MQQVYNTIIFNSALVFSIHFSFQTIYYFVQFPRNVAWYLIPLCSFNTFSGDAFIFSSKSTSFNPLNFSQLFRYFISNTIIFNIYTQVGHVLFCDAVKCKRKQSRQNKCPFLHCIAVPFKTSRHIAC